MHNPEEAWLLGPAAFLFQTPVARKPRKQASDYPKRRGHGLVRTFVQVARRCPEVMVKVTGSARVPWPEGTPSLQPAKSCPGCP